MKYSDWGGLLQYSMRRDLYSYFKRPKGKWNFHAIPTPGTTAAVHVKTEFLLVCQDVCNWGESNTCEIFFVIFLFQIVPSHACHRDRMSNLSNAVMYAGYNFAVIFDQFRV